MLKSTFAELLEKVRNLDKKTNEYVLQQFRSIYSQSSIPTTISSKDREINELVLQQPRSLYSQILIPIFIASKEGKIIEYNEAMFELTGYTQEEVPDIESWMTRLYPDEEYREKVIEIRRKSQQSEFDVKRYIFIITRKDGEKRLVEFFVYDVLHEGKPTDLQVIQGVDITERKKAEQEKEKLLHKLGERIKEQTCLYNLSRLVMEENITLDEIFQETANLIPPGWQYPEITCAR